MTKRRLSNDDYFDHLKSDSSFYSIWRNSFIRKNIRNKLCSNIVIDISLDDLDQEYKYLSLFSSQDKIENNILISLTIESKSLLNQYVVHPHKHIINSIWIQPDEENDDYDQYEQEEEKEGEKEQEDIESTFKIFDCNLIHDGVIKFGFHPFYSGVKLLGTLPNSLKEICWQSDGDNFNNTDLDNLLSTNLPIGLETLYLPFHYNIEKDIHLPSSLEKLVYNSNGCKNLEKFIVPPNKTYKDCVPDINSIKDLQWLENQKWVTTISIVSLPCDLKLDLIPNHITCLTLKNEKVLAGGSLPEALESLRCKYIHINGMVLPSNLKHLFVDTWETKTVLPNSLESFTVYSFNQPLQQNSLPPNLKKLELSNYNQDLKVGVLPQSLTRLDLGSFNKPLCKGVLPYGLKELIIQKFNNTLGQDSLPKSITTLEMYAYKGSFQDIGCLENLSTLGILFLCPSISSLLSNVKVKLIFKDISPNLCLSNTSIKDLELVTVGPSQTRTLHTGLLPNGLVRLNVNKIPIHTNDIIPNGCVSLHSTLPIKFDILPPSIKFINNKSIKNYFNL
ncbi:hypothetical protein CYY_004597 [Polysphondylium violaceum]|uniref:FNIP repeat-containing protein n=1 Tax=Polysphondylium violaceum TaxID=133409 RepID=A0A8J4PWD1_9MYCE|nr:hypothetical protein CYY_004597 [Polysphondylium violaceum]